MPSRFFNSFLGMVFLTFFSLMVSCTGAVESSPQSGQSVFPSPPLSAGQASSSQSTDAQPVTPSLPDTKSEDGIGLASLDANSFYYYSDGVRVELTPYLEWISVRPVRTDPAEYSAILQGSIVDPDGQMREIPSAGVSLLPLRSNLDVETLARGINALRAERSSFYQVNPVFEAGQAAMIVTDQFIATFPAEKGKEEIEAINRSHGVELIEPVPGQVNTFILKATEKAEFDAHTLANMYQENDIAIYAAPNFIRMIPE